MVSLVGEHQIRLVEISFNISYTCDCRIDPSNSLN